MSKPPPGFTAPTAELPERPLSFCSCSSAVHSPRACQGGLPDVRAHRSVSFAHWLPTVLSEKTRPSRGPPRASRHRVPSGPSAEQLIPASEPGTLPFYLTGMFSPDATGLCLPPYSHLRSNTSIKVFCNCPISRDCPPTPTPTITVSSMTLWNFLHCSYTFLKLPDIGSASPEENISPLTARTPTHPRLVQFYPSGPGKRGVLNKKQKLWNRQQRESPGRMHRDTLTAGGGGRRARSTSRVCSCISGFYQFFLL